MSTKKEFYLTTEIKEDTQRFNWDTYSYDDVKSNTSQRYFVENLAGLTDEDTVELYINSMGGSVKEALGIYNAIKRCPAKVTAYIDGFAASAASVIAMAADEIIMPRNTCMMIHNAAWWAYGNPAQLRKSAEDLEVINSSVINSYCMHAGDKLPASKLVKMLNAETWVSAEDCVKYGLADRLGDEDADLRQAAEQFKAAAKSGSQVYAKAPAWMSGIMGIPTADAPEGIGQKATESKQEPQPEAAETNKSGIYLLLKTITNMEENK